MITQIILAFTVLISYLAWKKFQWLHVLSHRPWFEVRHHQWYRLLTAGFVHSNWNHLLINMFVLYQFGSFTESYFVQRFGKMEGPVLFVILYLTSVIAANLGTLLSRKNDQSFSSIGASGATSSLVLIYVLFAPWQMFLFPPVPAIIFAGLYIAYSTWASRHRNDHIDHQAHLWGSVYGVVFILVLDPSLGPYFLRQIQQIPFLT